MVLIVSLAFRGSHDSTFSASSKKKIANQNDDEAEVEHLPRVVPKANEWSDNTMPDGFLKPERVEAVIIIFGYHHCYRLILKSHFAVRLPPFADKVEIQNGLGVGAGSNGPEFAHSIPHRHATRQRRIHEGADSQPSANFD